MGGYISVSVMVVIKKTEDNQMTASSDIRRKGPPLALGRPGLAELAQSRNAYVLECNAATSLGYLPDGGKKERRNFVVGERKAQAASFKPTTWKGITKKDGKEPNPQLLALSPCRY